MVRGGLAVLGFLSWRRMATCESAEMSVRHKNGAMSRWPARAPTCHMPEATLLVETKAAPQGEEHPRSIVDTAAFVSLANNFLNAIGQNGCFKRLVSLFPIAFGYAEQDLLDQPFVSFIHPADAPATCAALSSSRVENRSLRWKTAFAVWTRRTVAWAGQLFPPLTA